MVQARGGELQLVCHQQLSFAGMASAAQHGRAYDSQEVDMQEEIDEGEEVYTVHVEVRLKRKSTARMDFIKQLALEYLSQDDTLFVPSDIMGWEKDSRLVENVESMAACETCE
jgi:hypothetical protein